MAPTFADRLGYSPLAVLGVLNVDLDYFTLLVSSCKFFGLVHVINI